MNPANSAEALSNLQATQAQSQDPNTILSGQRQQLGVDKAQETVTGLRGAINNTTKLLQQVAPSVMGRTASSLVTNAQATKQIGNEQAPISQTLGQQTNDYNQAGQDLSQLNQRAQEAASGIYQGQQDKLSYAQNLYNTLYQKEQAAQAAAQAEKDRQEQIRQFNEGLSASKASSAAANRSFDLSTPTSGNTQPTTDPVKQKATSAVQQLLSTNNPKLIQSTYDAIKKSAGYGNTYDKLKLQLIESLYPAAKNFGKNEVVLR